MKQFLITVAGVVFGMALFVFVGFLAVAAMIAGAMAPAPMTGRNVLVLDLRAGLSDQEPQSPLTLFAGKSLSVLGIEETLHRAQSDGRVAGLLVRLPEGGMPPAAADELAAAFRRFRAAGKPILAYSQGLYAAGTVASTYELAAASGDIWMQPSSAFQVTGLARQDIFFKRLFDAHAVKPDYQQRYEYKTAVNPYLYSDYTPAHRESEVSWMGSVYDATLQSAAADRARAPADLKALIEAGPYLAQDAKAKGLIDNVGQLHQAGKILLARAGTGARFVPFNEYAGREPADQQAGSLGAAKVAVILAEGDIMTGEGRAPNPLGGGQTIRSDDIAKAFYAAIDDRQVKAIVFRISSPGGSDTASEQILAAVRAAKAAGKPVVVSMGTYGASGGYWIASQASEIIAEPTTLTGSIGVFGGKFALGEALAKFGVDMRGVKVGGDFADALGAAAPMTAGQRAVFSAWMDRIYDGFVGRVAEGRRLSVDRVRQIAKGRVWTGAQAKSLGLVDRLGGFYDAVDRAQALAGIRGAPHLQFFNTEASPFEALRRVVGATAQSVSLLSRAAALADEPTSQALMGQVADARLRDQGATVLMSRLVR